jgi:hypothetical protein
MQKTDEIVPWERSGKTGYASLDLTLTLGTNIGTIAVHRHRPDQPDAGNFVAYHNDNRISDCSYAKRNEACAEAEQYLYELPQFKASNTAVAVAAMIERGREGYREGKSIYDNPVPADRIQSRTHWARGWLESHAASGAAKALNAAIQTARANQQLEQDLSLSLARVTVHKLAIRFALEKYGIGDPMPLTDFLQLFLADDANKTCEAFPDWPKFVSEQTGAEINIIPPNSRN